MKKSKRNNPMIIDMIKDDVRVELILWPLLQVKLEVDSDVAWYEIHPLRVAEPFRALSEICYQHHADLSGRGVASPSLRLLKELESITGMGGMYPLNDLKAAGWTIPDFRRMEVAA